MSTVVVGRDSAPPAPRPSPLPALAALVAVGAVVVALQGGTVTTADDPVGLRVVQTRTWQPAPPGAQWTLSRVYAAPDGRALAFTARRGAGGDTRAVVDVGGPGEVSLVEWDHLGFGYTILAVGIGADDLRAVAAGIVYDRTGLGTMAVPRPGDLPDGLFVLDQRSGPSAGPGTGPTGTVTVLEDPATSALVTVTASDDAVVTAAHLSGLLRLTPRGSGQIVLDFPGGVRWLVADRGDTTIVAEGTDVSPGDLARALTIATG